MARKSALGNTFDSIFDDFDGFSGFSGFDGIGGESGRGSVRLQILKIGEIEPNREQPRKDFDPEKLEILAESIRQQGIIQPITVRELPQSDGFSSTSASVYQIVAGERRWRAARIAGLTEVPARIMELTDAQTMQIALIENLQREDLNPVEEAQGYQELVEKFDMTQEQLANVVGKARSSVANSLRLLVLPEEVLDLVRKNLISKGHCKAIMSAESAEMMIQLAFRAAEGELSVRETERLARLSKNSPKKARGGSILKPFFKESELALGQVLNTKVRIVDNKKKKMLCIDFADDEQLKDILSRF